MNFSRRFYESEDVDWDSVARQSGKYTSLADFARKNGETEKEIKEALNLSFNYPQLDPELVDFDDGNFIQLKNGLWRAAVNGAFRRVWTISDADFVFADIDISETARCCGFSEDEMEKALGYIDESGRTPTFDDLERVIGVKVSDVITGQHDLDDFIYKFYEGCPINDELLSESSKRTVNTQISSLKESIFKAQKTLARLQRM